MKTKIFATLFLLGVMIKSTVTAQSPNLFQDTTRNNDNSASVNMVKINLSSILFKGIGIQYERQIGKRTTILVGISFIPTSTVSFKSQLEKSIDNPRVNVDQFKLGTTIITPEFRYYLGSKGAFHGFYLAPYVRLGKYHVEGPVTYNSSTNSIRTAIFDGSLTFISGGLMVGSSFKLSNKLYLDWWILGAGFGVASGNVRANSKLSPDDQRELKRELDRTNIPFTSTKNEVTSTGATITSSGSVIGLRGGGINIGYRF